MTPRTSSRRPLPSAITAALAVLLLAACNAANSSPAASTSGATAPDGSQAPSAVDAPKPLDAPSPGGMPLTRGSGEAGARETSEMHAYNHDGITRFVVWSLDTLSVPLERHVVIDLLRRDLEASMAPVRSAEKSLVLTLAGGVAAGSVDARAMDSALARFEVVASSRGSTAELLRKLHAALTPLERATLVDKVAAHYELSRDANEEEQVGDKKGRLAVLAEQIGLDPDKVAQIRTVLRAARTPASDESRAKLTRDVDERMRAFHRAFVGDTFDAKLLAGGDAVDARLAAAGATRMVHFIESATPVLTPAQRIDLAARMRDRATDPDPLSTAPTATTTGPTAPPQ